MFDSVVGLAVPEDSGGVGFPDVQVSWLKSWGSGGEGFRDGTCFIAGK